MSLILRFARHGRMGASSSSPIVNFSSLGLSANDPFIVPANVTVMVDADTPLLGATDISGTVIGDGQTRTFNTTGITVENGGWLKIGTLASPYPAGHVFTINLTGAFAPLVLTTIAGLSTPTTSDPSNRGIMVNPGGKVTLCGTPLATPWTTLNASAAQGATALTLAASPGWSNNDPVLVVPTDFVDYQGVEQFTLNGATSGTAATLSSGLAASRYGVLQYPTDSGLSTTPGTFSTTKGSANVATQLDERARVINMSRNVVVTCPNDSDWTNKGHGIGIMGMASNGLNQCTLVVDSTQLRRGGIRGALGRYPFHLHMLSYNSGTGAFTADASQCQFTNNVVWDSENRAYTIHGTCGATVSGNVSYNVRGHAFFMEDGSERRNTITNNLALKTQNPLTGSALPGSITSMSGNGVTTTVNWTSHGLYSGQTVDVSGASVSAFNVYRVPVTVVNANQFTYPCAGSGSPTGASFNAGNNQIKSHDGNSSGYWITNLDNTITGNHAAGTTGGHGAWLSLAAQCFGLSANVAVVPDALATLSLSAFTCHSNFGRGINHRGAVLDESGNIGSGNKYPTAGGGTFTSTDHRLWKNSSGGYFNNVNIPTYLRWVVADNGGATDFQGSTNNGGIAQDHLGVGFSLNSATGGFTGSHDREVNDLAGNFGFYPRAGFATYHGTIAFTLNSWFNYPYHAVAYQFSGDSGIGGGMFEGGIDYYDIAGVDRTNGLNSSNKLFNTHPGAMCPPIHLDNRGIENNSGAMRHWSISQVWLDIDGKYGTAGKYMLPISPGTGLVDDFYLNSATNLADGPTSGTVVCKTTDTKYHGFGCSDVSNVYLKYAGTPVNGNLNQGSNISRLNPLKVTRQDPSLGTTIGTPFLCKRADTSSKLNGYHTVELQNAGRFKIDFSEDNVGITLSIASPAVCTYINSANHGFSGNEQIIFSTTGALPTGITAGTPYYVLATGLTSSTFRFAATPGGAAINTSGSQSGTHTYSFTIDPPDSMMAFDIISPGTAAQGDYMLLGLPWNGGTPRIFVGNNLSNEPEAAWTASLGSVQTRNTAASALDISNGKAYQASTAQTTIAAVLADTTGQSYFNDTSNKRVWIRFTNRNNAGSAALPAVTGVFGVQLYQVVIKV
jgi:hypothetical protein